MYAGTAIYEIHACAQEQWQIVATFDDPNAAVAEAVRLRGSRRYVGICVTEAFHDAVEKFATRVIYRYTAAKGRHGVIASQPDAAVIDNHAQEQALGVALPRAGTASARRETESDGWSLGRFLPIHLSVVVAATLLALMTIGAA